MADLEGMLGRNVGPLPVWSWVMIGGGVGMLIFKFTKGKKTASSTSGTGSSPGQGDTFQSSQSQSGTAADGGQYTSNYSAQGNGFMPGMLTWGAGPMPTQQGDVYVNLPPAASNTPAAASAPGALTDLASHIFPASTNITWTLGTGTTTDVEIKGTSEGTTPGFTVHETVDTRGQSAGSHGGHMFFIDSPSRGLKMNYTLTPYNDGVAGPVATISAQNAK